MIFQATQRENRAVVMAVGAVVTVQLCDCGEVNGEHVRTSQMIADTLTVINCNYLWGLGPGMNVSPLQPTVWLEVKGQPTSFDGATLDQAIAKAAARIRGEA